MFNRLNPTGLPVMSYTNTVGAGSAHTDATVVTNRAFINVNGPTNTAATGIKIADISDDGIRSDEAVQITVYNGAGSNTLVIYPDTGGTINGATANAGVTVATKTITKLYRTASNGTSGGTWLASEAANP